MARTDNLTNYLTDVATAIKTKKGDNTPIKASNFDTEIANLPSGGGADMSEYMLDTYTTDTTSTLNSNVGHWINLIKKLRPITELPARPLGFFAKYNGGPLDFSQVNRDVAITTASYMFAYTDLVSLNIGPLNFDSLTNANYMFYQSKIGTLEVGNNTFPNVTSWSCTFMSSNVDMSLIKKIDFSNVKQLGSFAYGCTNLTGDLEINSDDLYEIGSAFQNTNIESLKISAKGGNSSNVKASSFARGCTKLKTLDMSGMSTFLGKIKATSSYSLQYFVRDCTSLENLIFGENYGNSFATSLSANNTYATLDFSTCTSLTKTSVLDVFNKVADISNKNTQQIILPSGMLAQLTSEVLAIPTNKGWTVL